VVFSTHFFANEILWHGSSFAAIAAARGIAFVTAAFFTAWSVAAVYCVVTVVVCFVYACFATAVGFAMCFVVAICSVVALK